MLTPKKPAQREKTRFTGREVRAKVTCAARRSPRVLIALTDTYGPYGAKHTRVTSRTTRTIILQREI